MTAKRDLKRLIRERQARTGEAYTTARHHVLAQQSKSAVPVLELLDLSRDAARLGFRCGVSMFPGLAERIDSVAVLERIRDVLLTTVGDRGAQRLLSVVLLGERFTSPRWPLDLVEEGRRLVARAQAGIGGVSAGGSLIALNVEGRRGLETVIGFLWQMPIGFLVPREPILVLTSPEDLITLYSSLGVMVDETGMAGFAP